MYSTSLTASQIYHGCCSKDLKLQKLTTGCQEIDSFLNGES